MVKLFVFEEVGVVVRGKRCWWWEEQKKRNGEEKIQKKKVAATRSLEWSLAWERPIKHGREAVPLGEGRKFSYCYNKQSRRGESQVRQRTLLSHSWPSALSNKFFCEHTLKRKTQRRCTNMIYSSLKLSGDVRRNPMIEPGLADLVVATGVKVLREHVSSTSERINRPASTSMGREGMERSKKACRLPMSTSP